VCGVHKMHLKDAYRRVRRKGGWDQKVVTRLDDYAFAGRGSVCGRTLLGKLIYLMLSRRPRRGETLTYLSLR
jgi:hypothetical protein